MENKNTNNFRDVIRRTPWLHWMHVNLFSSTTNTILTLITIYLVVSYIPPIFQWIFIDSVLFADSRNECREIASGACWAFIRVRFEQFLWGFYPEGQRWRLLLALIGLFFFLLPLLYDQLKNRKYWVIFSIIYPVLLVWLLWGGFGGLEPVSSDLFGGILLTLVIGVTGILISLPIGIMLALGRRSNMLFIRFICVAFIEYIRGVPLITLLFVASTMLNYFLPPGTDFDLLARVLIMVVLFSSGY
ncbi:MAG: ABC transporter permease subunit, partial [Pseudomonadota bacterium]